MNCFLVSESDGLTLVDSTISSPEADVTRVSEELGLPLKRVVLTHAHSDHTGGVAVEEVVLPLFASVAMRTQHHPAALERTIELRKIEPARLAVGHGDSLADPGMALGRALETVRRAFG